MAYYAHESFKQTSPQLAATEESIPRPEELNLLDQLTALGMKFADGGYKDQPWFLMKCLEAASAGKNMFVEQQIRTTPSA